MGKLVALVLGLAAILVLAAAAAFIVVVAIAAVQAAWRRVRGRRV